MRGALLALLLATVAALGACSRPEPSPPLKPTSDADRPLRTDTRLDSGAPSSNAPAISIIIDDLGEQYGAGERALKLPGRVALAFLPGTPYAAPQAKTAHSQDKEILLHLPLQHAGGHLLPLGLSTQLKREDYTRRVAAALKTVPHALGINNHQGSLLTQMREPMRWLMQDIRATGGLYFVDSRTAANSVAYEVARGSGVAAGRRDVFLDAERGEDKVRVEWQRLLRYALKNGSALAIGHPYPETLALLETELPKLSRAGIRLIPPSELIHLQGGDRRRSNLRLSPRVSLANPEINPPVLTPTLSVSASAAAGQP